MDKTIHEREVKMERKLAHQLAYSHYTACTLKAAAPDETPKPITYASFDRELARRGIEYIDASGREIVEPY